MGERTRRDGYRNKLMKLTVAFGGRSRLASR